MRVNCFLSRNVRSRSTTLATTSLPRVNAISSISSLRKDRRELPPNHPHRTVLSVAHGIGPFNRTPM